MTDRWCSWKDLGHEWRTYGRYIFLLFRPGVKAPVFPSDPNKPGEVNGWSEQELTLVVEEGRRQSDRVSHDLEHVQARAQILLTTGIAILIGAAAGTRAVVDHGGLWLFLCWGLTILLVLASVFGATAILVVRADREVIHATVLSNRPRPVLRELAAAYASSVTTRERTFATRLTLFRDAVLLLLLAGAALFGLWGWALT
jgi:hypothetical protein